LKSRRREIEKIHINGNSVSFSFWGSFAPPFAFRIFAPELYEQSELPFKINNLRANFTAELCLFLPNFIFELSQTGGERVNP
jgi:hypothetical protein